ncbi:hypothetical protein HSX11_14030 [Oxalobacteraceae bacterium]|nr:hypothetical protein [Oxalobacteraceae bacterium]
MDNKELIKGIAILVGLILFLAVGAVMLTDNGVQKLGCVGRALVSGVAFGNIHAVCDLH